MIAPSPRTEINLRGAPAETIRDHIVEAADEHFSRFGYAKTTVSDLAKAIGFSKAYIYKFFDSKRAIGEAICARCLGLQVTEVEAAVSQARGAHEKLRALFRSVMDQSREQFFADRQLYDIVMHSCTEQWPSSTAYVERLEAMLREIVVEGREAGDFERKTPIDDVVTGIWLSASPFIHPVMLQYNLDGATEGLNQVTNLALRSLAP